MTNQPQNLEGKTLSGRYVLDAPVGGGGMGDVYPAFDTQLQRKVAIKVFRFGTSKNWKREIRAIVSLDHRNIVKIYDADTDDNFNYIAMQWLPGGALDVRQRRPLPEVAQIIKELAEALQYAHDKGIIHRDVKHGNVMIGEQGQPVLIDFSIATGEGIDATRTNIGASIGTYTHMSPEQCQGEELTPATDQYSLAIIAYNLITGELPFNPPAPTPMAYMYMHITAQPPVPWNVPGNVSDVLLRGLAKTPADRFPKVIEFALALEKSISQPNGQQPTPPSPQPIAATYAGLPAANATPNPDATLADPVVRVPTANNANDFYSGTTLPPGTPLPFVPVMPSVTQPPAATIPPNVAEQNVTPAARPFNPLLIVAGLIVVALVALLSGVGIALLLRPQAENPTQLAEVATQTAIPPTTLTATTAVPTSIPTTMLPTSIGLTATAAANTAQSAFETATKVAFGALAVAQKETPTLSLTYTASATFTHTATPSETATLAPSPTTNPTATPRSTDTPLPTDDLDATINAMVAGTATSLAHSVEVTQTTQARATGIVITAQARLTLTERARPTITSLPTATLTHTPTPTFTPTNTTAPSPTLTPLPTETKPPIGGGSGLLAFVSTRNGKQNIYTIALDGTNLKQLTNSDMPNYDPLWSFDGSRLMFDAGSGSERDIYSINADGSDIKRITTTTSGKLSGLASLSPDGKQLIFVTNRSGNFEIFKSSADGSSAVNISKNATADSDPVWSPDGKRIAFASDRSKNWDIYLMNADGSSLKRLTTTKKFSGQPAWSPDGTQIVFTTDRDGNREIYVMNADGSSPINITKNTAIDQYPTWTPDGKHILFISDRDKPGNDIYMVDPDGSNLRRITNKAEVFTTTISCQP